MVTVNLGARRFVGFNANLLLLLLGSIVSASLIGTVQVDLFLP